MSKYIEVVEALSEGGVVLADSDFDGDCTGCFQGHNLESLLMHEGIHSLRVYFDEGLEESWVNHKLIQALAPGIYIKDDCSVVIPSYLTTPFDQVICALRLIRHYNSFGEFKEHCYGINDDSNVNILGWSHRQIKENPFDKIPPLTQLWAGYCNNTPKFSDLSEEVREKAFDELEDGLINPGVLPPGNIIGGYEKAWNIFPREYATDREDKWDRELYEPFRKHYRNYLKKHGNVNWTVDHPVCITPMGDCR